MAVRVTADSGCTLQGLEGGCPRGPLWLERGPGDHFRLGPQAGRETDRGPLGGRGGSAVARRTRADRG